MVNGGYTNLITLQDVSSTTKIWDGEPVYLIGASVTFGGENLISTKPKTFQETILTSTDSNSYKNNYNRRKANVSYSGFQNHNITVTCFYDSDLLTKTHDLIVNGTEIASARIFTPSKLMEIILKPRTLYLKDHLLYGLLSVDEGTYLETPAIWSTNGIPVILKSYTIEPPLEGKQIKIALSFIEDKEAI